MLFCNSPFTKLHNFHFLLFNFLPLIYYSYIFIFLSSFDFFIYSLCFSFSCNSIHFLKKFMILRSLFLFEQNFLLFFFFFFIHYSFYNFYSLLRELLFHNFSFHVILRCHSLTNHHTFFFYPNQLQLIVHISSTSTTISLNFHIHFPHRITNRFYHSYAYRPFGLFAIFAVSQLKRDYIHIYFPFVVHFATRGQFY